MGLHEARGMLAKGMKDLANRWRETKVNWDDAQSDAFEKRYIETVEGDMRTAMTAMDHLAVVLAQIERDCE
jgi:pyruvate/2-oxoglutarate dehydrogenase complex dihydrolipoamide acyltransferase (E2) component